METKATQLLRDDHKKVKGLFTQLDAIDLRAAEMKAGVLKELLLELDIHSRLEEQIFYPSVRERSPIEARVSIESAFDDHRQIEQLLEQLRSLATDSSDFVARFGELVEQVEMHVDQEEREILPLAERLFADGELARLGEKMLELKAALLSRHREGSPSSPDHAQNPNGGEQSRKAG